MREIPRQREDVKTLLKECKCALLEACRPRFACRWRIWVMFMGQIAVVVGRKVNLLSPNVVPEVVS